MNWARSTVEVVEAGEHSHRVEETSVETSLTLATVAMIVVAVALATTGQLLLKSGMTEIGQIRSLGTADFMRLVTDVATTWQTVAGLICFGASSVFWLVVLSRLPLSLAYPFVALSYLIILAFSTVVLRERPPLVSWFGASFIMLGIVMVGVGGFDRGS